MKLPASRSTGTTSPLIGIGLADRSNLERIHTHLRVVYLELTVSGVHDVVNTIDYPNDDLVKRAATKEIGIRTG